ncbi:RHS domain-containing protein [Candidatus Woesearchaeota archaeon]|nr:RHS domain-containing protein [Candidatus Woesearchaeota archaeon]
MILLISSVNAYEIYFYHNDHLGSPAAVTNSEGLPVWRADYDPFGETVNEVGDAKIKYNAKEEDSTGLLYYGARYYNPRTGRFITADTVKGEITDTQSQNKYVYVQNNPIKYIDLKGNQETSFNTAMNNLITEELPKLGFINIKKGEEVFAGKLSDITYEGLDFISPLTDYIPFSKQILNKENIRESFLLEIESERSRLISGIYRDANIPQTDSLVTKGIKQDSLLEWQKSFASKELVGVEYGFRASTNLKDLSVDSVTGLATVPGKFQLGLTYEQEGKVLGTMFIESNNLQIGTKIGDNQYSAQLSYVFN